MGLFPWRLPHSLLELNPRWSHCLRLFLKHSVRWSPSSFGMGHLANTLFLVLTPPPITIACPVRFSVVSTTNQPSHTILCSRFRAFLYLLFLSRYVAVDALSCSPLNTKPGMLCCARQQWLKASLFFALASSFRSNGILLSGFIFWGLIVSPCVAKQVVRSSPLYLYPLLNKHPANSARNHKVPRISSNCDGALHCISSCRLCPFLFWDKK